MQLQSYNPATGAVVGEVHVTPAEAVASVVQIAREAQLAWADRSLDERVALLKQAGAILRDRVEAIARLGTAEMGKPLREMTGEVAHIAKNWESELDEIAAALAPEVKTSSRVKTVVYRDAFGVAACISPWNFPVLMPHQEALPALVAGNTVVLKPSEETPLTAEAYADVLNEVLPPGVLQVIHGADAQGKALVAADVDLIVFTGSRAAGKHILTAAAGSLKRVILELGGKDPLVVLDDADIDSAAKFASRNSFRNAGQVCVSTERIYVGEAVHDAFVASLARFTADMPVGDGMAPETRIGPMVNARQRDHVRGQVERALHAGAKVAWRADVEENGNFLAPTVLTGVTHDMDIATDETFGPVACVIKVADEDEAVRLANDTPYGLGAVVFGTPDHARAIARRLTAGMIGVNQGLGTAGSTPWVGARESGYGFHSGPEGHRQFAQVRVVSEPL